MQIINDEKGVTRVHITVCGTRYTLIVDADDISEVKRIYYKGTDVTNYVTEVFNDERIEIEDELLIQLNKMNQVEMQFAA